MTTLLTRMFRDPKHCTKCQVGQGRNCGCRKHKRPRFEVSAALFWWTVLFALAGFWGSLGLWVLGAWK